MSSSNTASFKGFFLYEGVYPPPSYKMKSVYVGAEVKMPQKPLAMLFASGANELGFTKILVDAEKVRLRDSKLPEASSFCQVRVGINIGQYVAGGIKLQHLESTHFVNMTKNVSVEVIDAFQEVWNSICDAKGFAGNWNSPKKSHYTDLRALDYLKEYEPFKELRGIVLPVEVLGVVIPIGFILDLNYVVKVDVLAPRDVEIIMPK